MKNGCKKLLATVAALTLMQGAVAADFSVGRAPVKMPGEGWRILEIADKGRGYQGGGDVDGRIQSETKVFIKESSSKSVEALVVVRGSSGGLRNGVMVYTTECSAGKNGYASGNSGTRTSYIDCLQVLRKFPSESVLQAFAPNVLPMLKADNTVLPPALTTISSHFSNSNGTFLDVLAFFAPNFAGREGKAADNSAEGVEPQSVVWGHELSDAVRGSVRSLSGTLAFPEIEFKK
jgi:hypothetical protein